MKELSETENYIIKKISGNFELHRKVGNRTMFLQRSIFQTPLIVVMRKLEQNII